MLGLLRVTFDLGGLFCCVGSCAMGRGGEMRTKRGWLEAGGSYVVMTMYECSLNIFVDI